MPLPLLVPPGEAPSDPRWFPAARYRRLNLYRPLRGWLLARVGGRLLSWVFWRLNRRLMLEALWDPDAPAPAAFVPPPSFERDTLAALFDTLIPAGADPMREPGAVQAGALASYYEPLLIPLPPGVAPRARRVLRWARRALVVALEAPCLLWRGRRFAALSAADREAVLDQALRWAPGLFEGPLVAAKWCFAAGVVNHAGFGWLRVPGPNEGLESGYACQWTHRATADGNLP